MELSDYLDGGYGNEAAAYAENGYTPSVHASVTGPIVTANAQVSPLRRGLEGLRLGEFDARQLCFVRPLARLAWAFLATQAEGRTMDALGLLSVYRDLYNSQRAAIASGFSTALPERLPEIVWDDPMRISVALVLGGLTGSTAERRAALARVPESMGAVGAWFSTLQPLFSDQTGLRTYLEVPRVAGETVAASVLRAVQDDVATCLSPSSTIGPATGIRCPPGQILVAGRCQQAVAYRPPGTPSQNPSGGGGGAPPPPGAPPPARSSGGGFLLVIAVLAGLGYMVYRTEQKTALKETP